MAANFGKFFKKKLTKLKNQDNYQDDSEDSDGYQDPSLSCPTEPPGVPRGIMPVYPPPRPSSPKVETNLAHNSLGRRDDYQDPWDSKAAIPKGRTEHNNTQTDYEDPFDAKFCAQQAKRETDLQADEYSEPYEPVRRTHVNNGPTDAYDDPWDIRKNNLLNNNKNDTNKTATQMINIKKSGPRDDYSDPWDTKTSNSLKSTDEYDDTYSDPYDTDKKTVLDGTKHKKDDEYEDDDDLYDIPDDEMAMIGLPPAKNGLKSELFNSKPNNYASPSTRQNQPKQSKPSAPQRQPDYDVPWELNVKNVEQEFERQFSVSERGPKPTPRTKSNANVRTNPRIPSKPVYKNLSGILQQPKDYEIDPTIPLNNQAWFHGRIRRGDAEALLRNQPDRSYLIRNAESSKSDYSLSLRNNGETMHLKISCRDNKYILGVNSRPYDTIPEMIHHYSRNKLNILGDVHVKLQYPVLQEPTYFTVEPGT